MEVSADNLNKRRLPVEPDMKSLSYETEDKLSAKVFKVYPLVGDYVINEEALQLWQKNTRSYIEKRMDDRSLKFKPFVYEQVALIVIHYAKTWNSNEEGRFTRYVVTQLGYKDDGGKVWGLLSDALEIAFRNNNRFFVRRNGDREFYETVMVHSFGPNKSWYPLIDLLFSFYTVNLDWEYVPNDPLFVKLVQVLQNSFNNAKDNDDQYQIASTTYNLRVGIRRLVQERPNYCVLLFESMVRRIHQLLKNENKPSKRFIMQTVDQWFSDRISNSKSAARRSSSVTREPTDVALDYSSISIKYSLSNGKPVIRIPAIRLLDDETGDAQVILYNEDHQIASYHLDIRGNELGETIRPKTVPLPAEQFMDDEIHFRVVIIRNTSVIYDSEKKLWRSILFFSEGKEISVSHLKKERYEVFSTHPNKLGGTNIDTAQLISGLTEISLHKNYSIVYAGNTIAIDYSELQGIKIVDPQVYESVHYQAESMEYSIVKPTASLKVYCSDQNEAKKYSVLINGNIHSLVEYYDESAGNRYLIEFAKLGCSQVDISIIDIAAGISLMKNEYFVIPGFHYEFSKKCYVTTEELNSATVTVNYEGGQFKIVDGDGDLLQHEFENGVLSFDIPRLVLSFENIDSVFYDKYYRFEDIEENSKIRFINKSSVSYSVSINGETLDNPDEVYLKEYILKSDGAASIPVILVVEKREYSIAELVNGNRFIKSPTFVYENNILKWDGGISFVGDTSVSLNLLLNNDEKDEYGFKLSLGQQNIGDFQDMDFKDGDYHWSIFADDDLVCSGICFIGDKRKARFNNRVICINRITEDTDSTKSSIVIKPVYIDSIKYVDTCYVPTEDDIYDVYSGRMYWVTYYGEKKYYSSSYKTIKTGNRVKNKYKVNPVKIIYISDKYLRIVNDEDEGLYCFNNQLSSDPGYEITDFEPSRNTSEYLDVLFYHYHTELTKPISISITAEKSLSDPDFTSNRIKTDKQPEQIKTVAATSITSLQNMMETDQDTVINAPVYERILVNAGPGTGKTWTLIEKIIKMVQCGTDPETIQVLCFSRAAVEVIRKRMSLAIESGIVDVSLNLVDIRTFDSFASQLLYWVKDSDYKESRRLYGLEEFSYEERIKRFIEILRLQPKLIEQCEHLIIDEVQDLVMSRAEMVLAMIELLPRSCGVTLFGDACQAIYDYQVDGGMSSTDFYNSIEETKQFKHYAFSKNFRQTSQLQEYCERYRTAILSNDIIACNSQLEYLCDRLPEYNTLKIKNFDEDSLKALLTEGSIGILTRSNAQALRISSIFRKKNIPHVIQRRLTDDCLSGWIAALFNTSSLRIYDETSFCSSLKNLGGNYIDEDEIEGIWNTITNSAGDGSNYAKAGNLLRGIRKSGKSKGIYAGVPVAPVTISTIHRSKGREYDSVILLDSLISEHSDSFEEQRVNYVALSRAKEHIYKVELDGFFFNVLPDRRCYTTGYIGYSGKRYLSYLEIGLPDDLVSRSFCENAQTQVFIRNAGRTLVGRELFLQKRDYYENGYVVYDLVDKRTGLVIARTSESFSQDLEDAIRRIKNLPWHASIYDGLYPKQFTGIYINEVSSEISMVQGNEAGVTEYDGLVTWNTVHIEGYAKAEY